MEKTIKTEWLVETDETTDFFGEEKAEALDWYERGVAEGWDHVLLKMRVVVTETHPWVEV